jgi:hypothetical protein
MVTGHPVTCFMLCREREGALWRAVGARAAALACPTAHYAAVDAVHVMERVVVSGSRDRGISVWGINQVGNTIAT